MNETKSAPVQAKLETIFDVLKTKDFKIFQDFITQNGQDAFLTADPDGYTTFHWAVSTSNADIVKYFIENKVKVDDGTNKTGQRPIHWAAMKGNIEIFNLIILQGIDINEQDNKGYTPLMTSVQYGHIPLMTFIISKGAKLETEDKTGDNALHWAAYKGNGELVSLLIYFGLNPKRTDNIGQTPLHLACVNGNISAVRELLKHCDIDVRDNNGKTALDLARKRLYSEVVDLLERHRNARYLRFCDFNTLCFGPVGNSKGVFLFVHVILFCVQYPLYIKVALPRTYTGYEAFHYFYLVVNLFMWISFYGAHLREPGFLRTNTVDYHTAIRRMTYHSQYKTFTELTKSLSRLCHTCKLVRPYRSSHCKNCNRCVLAYDHHCPYLHNCVGYRNRVWFFVFVLAVAINAICDVFMCYLILNETPKMYSVWFGLFLSVLFGIMGLSLTIGGLNGACLNLTSNEIRKKKKYEYLMDTHGNFKNIFDRGIIYNIKHYFHFLEPSNLETASYEYSLDYTL